MDVWMKGLLIPQSIRVISLGVAAKDRTERIFFVVLGFECLRKVSLK